MNVIDEFAVICFGTTWSRVKECISPLVYILLITKVFSCFNVISAKKIIEFFLSNICIFKNNAYLCNAFEKQIDWRDGRVVDCGGLENRCTARYPGFESLSLRKNRMQMKENPCKLTIYGDFLFLVHSKNKHIKAFFGSADFPGW